MLDIFPRRNLLLAAASLATERGAAPAALLTVGRAGGHHVLTCGDITSQCAVGLNGIRADRHEGDRTTPSGLFPLRRVLFRPDRVDSVHTALPAAPIQPNSGWCTDSADPRYNTEITLPDGGSHEELWRDDDLYDIVVVIGYNDSPAIPGKGSAIFLHVSRPGMRGTDGCVAIPLPVLARVIGRCGAGTLIRIDA